MRLTVRLLTAAAVLSASTLAAHADTYQYTINLSAGITGSSGDTVVFDESALLQVDTTIYASSFISSTDPSDASVEVASVEINPVLEDCVNGSGGGPSCVQFNFLDGGSVVDFYGTPLNMVGTFTLFEPDEVVITDLGPSPSSVPEPSTFALLGTGLIGAAGALRRKLLPS